MMCLQLHLKNDSTTVSSEIFKGTFFYITSERLLVYQTISTLLNNSSCRMKDNLIWYRISTTKYKLLEHKEHKELLTKKQNTF